MIGLTLGGGHLLGGLCEQANPSHSAASSIAAKARGENVAEAGPRGVGMLHSMTDDEEQSLADEMPSAQDATTEESFRMPSFALSEQLIANLERRGLNIPTQVQKEVIPKIRYLRGKDICVNAPTGSGKTLAYALPITEVISLGNTDDLNFSIWQNDFTQLWGVSLSSLRVNLSTK